MKIPALKSSTSAISVLFLVLDVVEEFKLRIKQDDALNISNAEVRKVLMNPSIKVGGVVISKCWEKGNDSTDDDNFNELLRPFINPNPNPPHDLTYVP